MTNKTYSNAEILTALAISAILLTGWIANIYALAQSTSLSGMVVLRAIGIFVAQLGSFFGLGYLF